VSQTTVAKYIERRRTPPSPTWRTFLTTHVSQLASIDFFIVPTATFRVLFVLSVLSHDRRLVVYVNVTCHPTAAWTRQQIREAFPWDQMPRYLLRDRDAIYGSDFGHRLRGFGIQEVVSAPQAPWQNGTKRSQIKASSLESPTRSEPRRAPMEFLVTTSADRPTPPRSSRSPQSADHSLTQRSG
jgi:hypothetical protein